MYSYPSLNPFWLGPQFASGNSNEIPKLQVIMDRESERPSLLLSKVERKMVSAETITYTLEASGEENKVERFVYKYKKRCRGPH